MSEIEEGIGAALCILVANPFTWIVILFVGIVAFGSCRDIKTIEAKEKTKQVAMQLEIAKINTGMTNSIVGKE